MSNIAGSSGDRIMNGPTLSIIIPTARYSSILIRVLKYLSKTLNEEHLEVIIVSTVDNPANKVYEALCRFIKSCRLLILEFF